MGYPVAGSNGARKSIWVFPKRQGVHSVRAAQKKPARVKTNGAQGTARPTSKQCGSLAEFTLPSGSFVPLTNPNPPDLARQ